MALLGALSQAWLSAQASLPLTLADRRFMALWRRVGVTGRVGFEDYASGSGRYEYQALQRLSDKLRELRGVASRMMRAVVIACFVFMTGCQALLPVYRECSGDLLEGRLVADRLGGLSVHQGARFYVTVQWPGGFRVEDRDQRTLLDEHGTVVATEGQPIYVRGQGRLTGEGPFIACQVSRDPL